MAGKHNSTEQILVGGRFGILVKSKLVLLSRYLHIQKSSELIERVVQVSKAVIKPLSKRTL